MISVTLESFGHDVIRVLSVKATKPVQHPPFVDRGAKIAYSLVLVPRMMPFLVMA